MEEFVFVGLRFGMCITKDLTDAYFIGQYRYYALKLDYGAFAEQWPLWDNARC